MNGSKGNILVIMAIFALLLVFGGQALAQGTDTPTSIMPPTSTETGNSSWLQRMQEWMGPAARGHDPEYDASAWCRSHWPNASAYEPG